MRLLAVLGDPVAELDIPNARATANSTFTNIIEEVADQGIHPRQDRIDWERLKEAIIGLGYVADANSVEFLWQLTRTEYWESHGLAEIPGDSDIHNVRLMALRALATVADPTVAEAFDSGEAIPEDLRDSLDSLQSTIQSRALGGPYSTEVTGVAKDSSEGISQQ